MACDKNKPVPAIPEKKSSFQKTVFTEPQSENTVTLVSETECEINTRGNIILAEYSRQENKLRVVIRTGGGASVIYLELLPDGLRAPEFGGVFLLPEALNKAREQQKNPARMTTTTMVAASFGQIEMATEDDAKKRYTIREKKSGKLITIYWSETQKKPLVVEGDFSAIP